MYGSFILVIASYRAIPSLSPGGYIVQDDFPTRMQMYVQNTYRERVFVCLFMSMTKLNEDKVVVGTGQVLSFLLFFLLD